MERGKPVDKICEVVDDMVDAVAGAEPKMRYLPSMDAQFRFRVLYNMPLPMQDFVLDQYGPKTPPAASKCLSVPLLPCLIVECWIFVVGFWKSFLSWFQRKGALLTGDSVMTGYWLTFFSGNAEAAASEKSVRRNWQAELPAPHVGTGALQALAWDARRRRRTQPVQILVNGSPPTIRFIRIDGQTLVPVPLPKYNHLTSSFSVFSTHSYGARWAQYNRWIPYMELYEFLPSRVFRLNISQFNWTLSWSTLLLFRETSRSLFHWNRWYGSSSKTCFELWLSYLWVGNGVGYPF